MASLSDLPEHERRLVLRLAYWSWLALLLGATALVLWMRGTLPIAFLPVAAVLLALFVAFEVWQPIFVRRQLRRSKGQ